MISSLFGLTHGTVNQEQYFLLVAAVSASAVVPTMIAGSVFLPRHLLPEPDRHLRATPCVNCLSAEGRGDPVDQSLPSFVRWVFNTMPVIS
jgi:hypothetical protein